MFYYTFLRQVHALLEPRRYLEIGVRSGGSLALADCPRVGIDPAYSLTFEISGEVHLFRTTSDEYFSRPEPLSPVGGKPFDMAFIDGLHLFEFALRDFINTEHVSSTSSLIVFDDILPRTPDEAGRKRITSAWTGDVYPILEAFRRFRPDLATIMVDTQPTGLLLVVGLDPTDNTLADEYATIVDTLRQPDPQPVPSRLLNRAAVQAPQRVLDAGFWKVLNDQRGNPELPDFHARLREQLAADFGQAFASAGV